MARQSIAFAVTFAALFGMTYAFLATVDALPDPVRSGDVSNGTSAPLQYPSLSSPEVPTRVVAKSIGLDAAVVNPTSTDTETLDEALTHGAVRYPGSALLGEDGVIYMFGHSSYLPIVYHQYYKTFNGIQDLKPGDSVSVYSDTTEYRYRVIEVKTVDSAIDDTNLLAHPSGRHLTLSTCDSFAAKKSSRFVVEAEFAGAY